MVVAVVLGLAIVALKLGGPRGAPLSVQPAIAQPAGRAGAGARAIVGAPTIPSAAPAASVGAAAATSAAPVVSAVPAASASSASGGKDEKKKPAGLDYSVVQTDADFDKGLSEEQRKALGEGKVPIHREGPFKSLFAHPRFGGPSHVKVGSVISHVRDYNIQTGAFEAELFLSLTSIDKEMPELRLVFTNGKSVDQELIVDTPTFKLLRVRGEFGGPIDLRHYPFDTQVLPVEVEDMFAGVDQIVFEPDQARTSLDEDFAVPGWGVAHIAAKAWKHRYPPRFDRDDLQVSRYKVEVGLDRFGVSAALSVFVPAYMIVVIALTGMWVPARELEVRSNTGAPMLAAAVLFHYGLLATLPATGYLTRADKVMMGTYVALLLNMGSTWTFLIVPPERAAQLFRLWRWLVPTVSVAIMALATIV
ncbi:Hypothetical protein A7982_06566 [Minicystis rosea]|nr:Hypothetical protein A7982_06566 [Minicystis rosea]